GRSDVLTGAADDVLQAIDEVEAAIGAAAHAVAGVKPAVAPGMGGGLLVLQVPREEAAPGIGTFLPDQKFAGIIDSHVQLVAREAETPGADVARLAAGADQCASARLRHRPALDQRKAK